MTSPAIPETYPAMKSLRLSAASQYVTNDEVKYPCGESLGWWIFDRNGSLRYVDSGGTIGVI